MREIRRRKEYVEVTVQIDENGNKRSLSVRFQGLKTFEVEKLKHIIERKASKIGGTGKCYRVVILETETALYEEDEGKWFVEAKRECEVICPVSPDSRSSRLQMA